MKRLTIGSGGVGAGDQIGPAVQLADSGLVNYLAFDCLAERTLALAQIRRLQDGSSGYDERLPDIVAGLEPFLRAGKRLIGNFGAAHPDAAVKVVEQTLRKAGLDGVRIGVVRGDDVRGAVLAEDVHLPEMGCRVSALAERIVSANAYIGAEPIATLLADGSQIVIGGRIADPSLYVAPICHELGWALDDWDKVATATLVAHLLECGVGRAETGEAGTGPGFPLATVSDTGEVEITKLAGTSGRIDAMAVKLHLGYEIHDPAAYLTPDISVDFTRVWVREMGPNLVTVGGARGHPRPDTLKVLVGLDLGWKVVSEVSYGGPGCVERARAAAGVTRKRLDPFMAAISDLRFDLHGVDALFGRQFEGGYPADVRLRVAARCDTRECANAVMRVGNQLYSASRGGGGVTVNTTPAIGVTPALLPRSSVPLSTEVVTV